MIVANFCSPISLPARRVFHVLESGDMRIERIISHGDSPLYDQDQHGRDVVLRRAARLVSKTVKPGDVGNLLPTRSNRVEWTTPDERRSG